MTRPVQSLLVLLAFFAGCASSQVAMRYGVPPARAAAPVQRWEYQCNFEADSVTNMANKLGQEGWEMVAASPWQHWGIATQNGNTVWCFKRAIP